MKKTALTASAPADPPLARWDVASFERLYNAHAAAIYRFVFYRTGMDRAVAAEITGDVFLAAWSQPPVGSPPDYAEAAPLLFGIAKRKLVDFYRIKTRSREVRFSDLNQSERRWLEGMLSEQEGEVSLAGELSQEARQLVGEILSALEPHIQEMLVDKYVRRLSIRQLMEKTGKSEDAVTSLLARARVKFREAFKMKSKAGS